MPEVQLPDGVRRPRPGPGRPPPGAATAPGVRIASRMNLVAGDFAIAVQRCGLRPEREPRAWWLLRMLLRHLQAMMGEMSGKKLRHDGGHVVGFQELAGLCVP